MIRLHAIASMDRYGLLGRNGKLAIRLPNDLRHFKRTTMGHPIIMGRKTHEEIGRALDGRMNIVLSKNLSYKAPGCTVVHSVDEALYEATNFCEGISKNAFVIGGQKVFSLFWPQVKVLHLTLVDTILHGDVYFHLDPMHMVRDFPILKFETVKVDDTNLIRHCFYNLEVIPDYGNDTKFYFGA